MKLGTLGRQDSLGVASGSGCEEDDAVTVGAERFRSNAIQHFLYELCVRVSHDLLDVFLDLLGKVGHRRPTVDWADFLRLEKLVQVAELVGHVDIDEDELGSCDCQAVDLCVICTITVS